VNVALPHGDPAWDGRVRVRPITTAVAAAPLALQFPRGPTGAVAERVGAWAAGRGVALHPGTGRSRRL